ncbi:MAG: hypothetical protein IKN38_11005 [Clostridia bacterium]|nr:hypothetical protein [Clostridia bacterium]
MIACTFFGHRIVSSDLKPKLLNEIKRLITDCNVRLFYVGNNGSFDGMTAYVLNDLINEYDIDYFIVLSKISEKALCQAPEVERYTIFPEGLEFVPKRYAIIKRNEWMLKRCDYVITYIRNDIGSGAAKFREMAIKKKKTVIEL